MTTRDGFDRYQRILQELDAGNLHTLDDILAPNVHFKDPFHDVTGIAAMKQAFLQLFRAADDVEFSVNEAAEQYNIVYFQWTLTARLSKMPWSVTGVTRVLINAQGRVIEHIEYWDAASQFYERFPVIGPLLRHIRKRISRR